MINPSQASREDCQA